MRSFNSFRSEPLQLCWRAAQPARRLLFLGLAALSANTFAQLTYPQGLAKIVDALQTPLSNTAQSWAAWLTAALLLILGISAGVRDYAFHSSAEIITRQLRQQVHAALLRRDIAFFDLHHSGALANQLWADTTVVHGAISALFAPALGHLMSLSGALWALFNISSSAAWTTLAVVPTAAVAAQWPARRLRKIALREQEALAQAGSVAHEALAAVRTVRALGCEEQTTERLQKALHHALAHTRQRVRWSALLAGASNCVLALALLLMLWRYSLWVRQGALSPGQLTALLLYGGTVAWAVTGLASCAAQLGRPLSAAERLAALMHPTPSASPDATAAPVNASFTAPRTPARPGHIRLHNVSFAYPARPHQQVLQRVTLEIFPGEALALVGPSGSGKSTLAALLMGFYLPQSGTITCDDQDLRALLPHGWRQQVALVEQEPVLFARSIAHNIALGQPHATFAQIEEAAHIAGADPFIRALPQGYHTMVGERGTQLSGGQKQRLAIARALLRKPLLLILDEPTHNLDVHQAATVLEAVHAARRGLTTLLISHQSEALRHTQRTIHLENGYLCPTVSRPSDSCQSSIRCRSLAP